MLGSCRSGRNRTSSRSFALPPVDHDSRLPGLSSEQYSDKIAPMSRTWSEAMAPTRLAICATMLVLTLRQRPRRRRPGVCTVDREPASQRGDEQRDPRQDSGRQPGSTSPIAPTGARSSGRARRASRSPPRSTAAAACPCAQAAKRAPAQRTANNARPRSRRATSSKMTTTTCRSDRRWSTAADYVRLLRLPAVLLRLRLRPLSALVTTRSPARGRRGRGADDGDRPAPAASRMISGSNRSDHATDHCPQSSVCSARCWRRSPPLRSTIRPVRCTSSCRSPPAARPTC